MRIPDVHHIYRLYRYPELTRISDPHQGM